ncbi:MAG: DUF1553 domain-containing protein [Bryobacteraceae bacterium]
MQTSRHLRSALLAGVTALSFLGALQPLAPAQPRRNIDFVRDVQPIFSASCGPCHGAKQQMAQLRLDARNSVLGPRPSGAVVVPGKPDESTLWQVVAGAGTKPRMPFGGQRLPDESIEIIRQWIEQGASWPEGAGVTVHDAQQHWAYAKPVRPGMPAVRNASWPRNSIDYLVLSRLEKEGLAPSGEAGKETLIRRVSLDTRGLPPSINEIDAFLSDVAPGAYERLVDRMLGAPQYGERWARPWLDLARYADSNGYEKDRSRSIWLYRDWVIGAFNRNMPFDQFTIEQIAGDLLPHATLDQRIATGFHRNTLINDEGGVDAEEFRVAAVLDRVNTTATIWLGSTIGCAQCHNHKYDPFSQEEYYRFFALLNNDKPDIEADAFNVRAENLGPQVEVPTPKQAVEQERLQREVARHTATLEKQTPAMEAAQELWEKGWEKQESAWKAIDATPQDSLDGVKLTALPDKSVIATGRNPDQATYILTAKTDIRGITGIRLEAIPDGSMPNGGSGRAPDGNFILTGFELEVSPVKTQADPKQVVLSAAFADSARHGFEAERVVEATGKTGWSVREDGPRSAVHEAVFLTEVPVGFEGGTRVKFTLKQESPEKQCALGRFRISVTTAQYPGLNLWTSPGSKVRSQEQKMALAKYFRLTTPQLAETRKLRAEARERLQHLDIPTSMVIEAMPEPRESHILIRGNFMTKGTQVSGGFPAVLHKPAKGEAQGRLALARWLVDNENPLVARVTVNRIWEQYFGRGIVETPDDFGTRGDRPANPELLDWLAVEFMEKGWDLKAIHRLILNSATYRQASNVTPQLLERDPYNRLLARGPRFRLEAEFIRDIALTAGGILNSKIGGPSVYPPLPEGILKNSFSSYDVKNLWVNPEAADRYRRGIYTFWRRTEPYPSFLTFDAPRRDVCVVNRSRTNTPLQALVTLNDPAFVEAAAGLGQRMMQEQGTSGERIVYGFRRCVSRKPKQIESLELENLFRKSLGMFQKDPEAAKSLASSSGLKLAANTDYPELASWILVANVLLNLDETITKN